MTRRKNKEDETLLGYVLLVEAMLVNVFDRIRIKDSWYKKKISPRMLNRKIAELNELGAWLQSSDSRFWFNILGACTGRGSRKMHETFMGTWRKSMEFVKSQLRKRVDK